MSYLNNALSFSASLARLGFGIDMASGARKPEKRLVLYDFEACPFCRKAREALSHLGLEVEVRPTGRGSARREELRQAGGKVMVPYLIDPNTNKEMYESDDIVQYLYKTYGDGRVSWLHRLGPLNTALSFAASASRVTMGRRVVDGHNPAPAELFELYNMESSPYCRKVREALTELDLPYICKNAPKGSSTRDELRNRGGKIMVPFFVDPNNGVQMYESDEIVDYLYTTYTDSETSHFEEA